MDNTSKIITAGAVISLGIILFASAQSGKRNEQVAENTNTSAGIVDTSNNASSAAISSADTEASPAAVDSGDIAGEFHVYTDENTSSSVSATETTPSDNADTSSDAAAVADNSTGSSVTDSDHVEDGPGNNRGHQVTWRDYESSDDEPVEIGTPATAAYEAKLESVDKQAFDKIIKTQGKRVASRYNVPAPLVTAWAFAKSDQGADLEFISYNNYFHFTGSNHANIVIGDENCFTFDSVDECFDYAASILSSLGVTSDTLYSEALQKLNDNGYIVLNKPEGSYAMTDGDIIKQYLTQQFDILVNDDGTQTDLSQEE